MAMSSSSIQGPIQVVMLVVIIVFAIQYQQLLQKYEELRNNGVKSDNINVESREKETVEEEEHCVHRLHHRNTEDILILSSVTTRPDLYSAHREDQDNLPTFREKAAPNTLREISPSKFDTMQADFQTEEKLLAMESSEKTKVYSSLHITDKMIAPSKHLGTVHASSEITKTLHEENSSRNNNNENIDNPPQNPEDNLPSKSSDNNLVGGKDYQQRAAVYEDLYEKLVVYASTNHKIDATTTVLNTLNTDSSQTASNTEVFELQLSKTKSQVENIEYEKEILHSFHGASTRNMQNEIDSGHLLNLDGYGDAVSDMTEEVLTTDFPGLYDINANEQNHDGASSLSEAAKSLLSKSEYHTNILIEEGTSLWCEDHSTVGPSCYAKNLCYNTAEKDFIFLQSENSHIVNNFHRSDSDDLFSINLSSVPDHNAQLLRPVMIPAKKLGMFSTVSVVETPSLLLNRFKPDNIMHVLHDDILPLFHTLHSMRFPQRNQLFDITLVFTDNYDDDDQFQHLYSALTAWPLLTLWKVNTISDVVCFRNAYFGLSNHTLWYQYGFSKPQGPLSFEKRTVGVNIHRGTKYVAEKLLTDCIFCKNGKYLVVLSRKDNRLILNEGELIMALAQRTKLKVMSVSLETHNLKEIITIVKDSMGIIGIHGSLLSVAMFLQPGSFVVELFPYAVNPSKYTPFKTLCSFPALGLSYKSWVNQKITKSVAHPDWDRKLGGIHHLPMETQETITSQTEVPAHLCCEDPSWLYHAFQDTEVHTGSVVALTTSALSESEEIFKSFKRQTNKNVNIAVLPGPVRLLRCKLIETQSKINNFIVSWASPWNTQFVDFKTSSYHIIFQDIETGQSQGVDLSGSVVEYSLQFDRENSLTGYNVWVFTVLDDSKEGYPSYVTCKM